MRRHLALMGIIAILILAVFLFRPSPMISPPSSQSLQAASGQRNDSLSALGVEGEVATTDSQTPPPPNPETSESKAPEPGLSADLKPKYRVYGSLERIEVTVLDPSGQPVEGAAVVIFRTTDLWKTYGVSEARTDSRGKFELIRKLGVEKVRFHSYKPGVGSLSGSVESDVRQTLTYLPPHSMKIWCHGPYGNLRGGAQVAVTAELNIGTRDKESIWIKFPPRRLKADEYGRCELEGLPNLGPSGDGKTRMPGCRFAVSASWEGRTVEVKFDDFPDKEVQLIIE